MTPQTTSPATIDQERALVRTLAHVDDAAIVLNDEGWDSRAYIVHDGQYIFKFPRSEKIRGRYAAQVAALKLAAATHTVHIPEVAWQHPDNAYFGYKGVPGRAVGDLLMTLDQPAKQRIGRQLGTFLKRFHGLELPTARDMSITEEISQLQNWYEKGVALSQGLFAATEQARLHDLVYEVWPEQLARLGAEQRLCHGDFGFRNIFYSPEDGVGVIDFGDVCRSDPAKDFVNLNDEVMLESALDTYGDTSEAMHQKIALRRAMVQVIKLTASLGKQDRRGTERAVGAIKLLLG